MFGEFACICTGVPTETNDISSDPHAHQYTKRVLTENNTLDVKWFYIKIVILCVNSCHNMYVLCTDVFFWCGCICPHKFEISKLENKGLKCSFKTSAVLGWLKELITQSPSDDSYHRWFTHTILTASPLTVYIQNGQTYTWDYYFKTL